jgi:hypothetical protein
MLKDILCLPTEDLVLFNIEEGELFFKKAGNTGIIKKNVNQEIDLKILQQQDLPFDKILFEELKGNLPKDVQNKGGFVGLKIEEDVENEDKNDNDKGFDTEKILDCFVNFFVLIFGKYKLFVEELKDLNAGEENLNFNFNEEKFLNFLFSENSSNSKHVKVLKNFFNFLKDTQSYMKFIEYRLEIIKKNGLKNLVNDLFEQKCSYVIPKFYGLDENENLLNLKNNDVESENEIENEKIIVGNEKDLSKLKKNNSKKLNPLLFSSGNEKIIKKNLLKNTERKKKLNKKIKKNISVTKIENKISNNDNEIIGNKINENKISISNNNNEIIAIIPEKIEKKNENDEKKKNLVKKVIKNLVKKIFRFLKVENKNYNQVDADFEELFEDKTRKKTTNCDWKVISTLILISFISLIMVFVGFSLSLIYLIKK